MSTKHRLVLARGDAEARDDDRLVAVDVGRAPKLVAARPRRKSIRASGSHAASSGAAIDRADAASIIASAAGREFGRQRVRRFAVAAEEAVEHLEHELAVDHDQRAAAGPAPSPAAAMRSARRRARPDNRRSAAPRAARPSSAQLPCAAAPSNTPLQRLGEPRGEMLQRVQIAERIEVRRAQRRRVLRAGPGAFAPFGRVSSEGLLTMPVH